MARMVPDYVSIGETADLSDESESGVRALSRVRRPTMLATAHLARTYNLADQNRIDDAIDYVVGTVDGFLNEGRFIDVDALLQELDVTVVDSDVSVALLMATYPARGHLRERVRAIARLAPVLSKSEAADRDEILRLLG